MNKEFWTEGHGSFVVAILVALFIRWALMEAYVIPSSSMLPTLLIHDHIFVNKIVYGVRVPFTEDWLVELSQPERGEVIVFKYPDNMDLFYIKRVVGLPGDRVFYENGNLYVNEELVERSVPQGELREDLSWLRAQDFPGESHLGGVQNYSHWQESLGENPHSVLLRKGEATGIVFGPYEVPEGHYFVMGDNRDNSEDSRAWRESKRFVPRDNLVGRAMFVWLSCEETLPVVTFLCNPLTIRWSRFFESID